MENGEKMNKELDITEIIENKLDNLDLELDTIKFMLYIGISGIVILLIMIFVLLFHLLIKLN